MDDLAQNPSRSFDSRAVGAGCSGVGGGDVLLEERRRPIREVRRRRSFSAGVFSNTNRAAVRREAQPSKVDTLAARSGRASTAIDFSLATPRTASGRLPNTARHNARVEPAHTGSTLLSFLTPAWATMIGRAAIVEPAARPLFSTSIKTHCDVGFHTRRSAQGRLRRSIVFLKTLEADSSGNRAGSFARQWDDTEIQMPKALERILGSSKVWTAAAAAIVVILSVAGFDAVKATKVSASVVSLATAVILATGYEDGQQKGGGNGTNTPSPKSSDDTPAAPSQSVTSGLTKQAGSSSLILALLLLPLLPLLAAGCTPMSQAEIYGEQKRFEFEHGINADYAAHHPDSAQTIADFESTWKTKIAHDAGQVAPTTQATH